MVLYFSFEFSDSDFEGKGWERPITTYRFTITPTMEYDSLEWQLWYDDVMLEQTDTLEEYGVHDFTAGSEDSDEYFGYYTYEVPQDKWEELIQKWHEWFESKTFKPGKIEAILTPDVEG